MSIDKQALREAAEKASELNPSIGVKELARRTVDYYALGDPTTVLALLDELEAAEKRIDILRQDKDKVIDMSVERVSVALARAEAAEKRIADLSASHANLREAMAGIHNTITGGGAYTPLASILNASKRAYEESAAAAGISVKGE